MTAPLPARSVIEFPTDTVRHGTALRLDQDAGGLPCVPALRVSGLHDA